MLAGGCGRSGEEAPTATTAGTVPPAEVAASRETPEGAPAESPGGGDEGVSEAELARVTSALTQAVRRYGIEQRQVPANLDDLVARGYLSQVPEAPRGRRFIIDKQLQVQLVKE